MTSYPNDPSTDRPYDPGQQSYGSTAGEEAQSGYVSSTDASPEDPYGTGVSGAGVEGATGTPATGSYGTGTAAGSYGTTSAYETTGAATGSTESGSTADALKGKAQDAADSVRGPAADVKDTAHEAGRQVAQTAKSEARDVLHEGKQQGRRVLDEGMAELRNQAAGAQGKLADTFQALADELREMVGGSQTNGTVANFAGQAQDYTERAASWLRDNDMDAALHGVRRFAARNPWGFLAISAGAGLLVGRLARGLKDAGPSGASSGSYELYGRGGYGQGYGTEQYGRPYGEATAASAAYGDPNLETAYGQAVAGQSGYDRPIGSDGGARPADYGIHGESGADEYEAREEGTPGEYETREEGTPTEYDVRSRGTDIG